MTEPSPVTLPRRLLVTFAALVVAILSACTSLQNTSKPSTNATSSSSSAPSGQSSTQVTNKEQVLYTIDPAQTQLHLLVYRAGTFARLGHNHVVSSRSVSGNIWLGDSLASSNFDIKVPVKELIVDDDAARQAEGDDFPLNVQQAAKDATKANMLRDNQLDAEQFPFITLEAAKIQGNWSAATVQAYLRIKDHTRSVSVPVQLERQGNTLRVKGEFQIRQTDFGITPLSVAMGAIQVQNQITIKFQLVATHS